MITKRTSYFCDVSTILLNHAGSACICDWSCLCRDGRLNNVSYYLPVMRCQNHACYISLKSYNETFCFHLEYSLKLFQEAAVLDVDRMAAGFLTGCETGIADGVPEGATERLSDLKVARLLHRRPQCLYRDVTALSKSVKVLSESLRLCHSCLLLAPFLFCSCVLLLTLSVHFLPYPWLLLMWSLVLFAKYKWLEFCAVWFLIKEEIEVAGAQKK